MSEISNKAIMIGASLLVTIAITSSILMVVGYFRQIYADVQNTDISLRKMFTEYDTYDNTVMTGIDIENTYNKYKNEPAIKIFVGENNELKKLNINNNNQVLFNDISVFSDKQDFYATKYDVTYVEDGNGNIKITFIKQK